MAAPFFVFAFPSVMAGERQSASQLTECCHQQFAMVSVPASCDPVSGTGGDEMDDVHTGRCLCGTVRFAARGPLRGVVYCHCSQCRRQTGHHYAATNVAVADLDVTGEGNVTWYRASGFAGRGFCATCGSALFWKRDGADDISVMAGTFDSPSSLRGVSHIFVAGKGDYYDIDDGLPQHARSSADVVVAED